MDIREPLLKDSVITINNWSYNILELYSCGGNSLLYKATMVLGHRERKVLIKEFYPVHKSRDQLKDCEVILKLYYQELDSLLLLQNKKTNNYLPEVLNCGLYQGVAYIVLEEFEGQKFSDVLTRTFDLRKKVDYMIQMTELVMHLNSLNPQVVHLDLKPSNLILDSMHRLYLIDLGSVYIKGQQWVANFTETYSSPEVVYNRVSEVGIHSDIYSLGCIFYEMVENKKPVMDDFLFMKNYVNHEGLDNLLKSMLENLPHNRIQSYKEVLIQLKAVWREMK